MRTIVIAEAGVNHNSDLEIAKKLIDVAADAGADYVKFQTFKASKLVSPNAKKADYQQKNTNDEGGTQFEMLQALELSESDHINLYKRCQLREIGFLSTGFDEESLDYLIENFTIDYIKIPSGEITNKPFLQHAARKGKSIILSSGMADLQEVQQAVDLIIEQDLPREMITVLHCNTQYPTPFEDVNLNAMITIRDEVDVATGYSDHTLGINIPVAAVAMGAKLIEKHFTLDRNLPGPDHKASLEPDELRNMIESIRQVESAIGTGQKVASPSEKANISIARKSIHLKNNVPRGKVLEVSDLIMLRPGDGISPMQIDLVIGRNPKRDLETGHQLVWDDLNGQ